MTCDQACLLIDDYLENRLGHYERQRLENHMVFCPACAEELRNRPAFERTMLRQLTASVQHLHLSPSASQRIVRAAQSSSNRAVWSNRGARVVQALAGVAAVALVVVGVMLLAGQIQVPPDLPQAVQPQANELGPSLRFTDLFVEPRDMSPGDTFTITVLLRSDLPESLATAHFNLDIDGPEGDYRFALAARGPLPARGVSVLEVTSEQLADPCQEQYQIVPTDIFRAPGVYTVRATLFGPAAASGQ